MTSREIAIVIVNHNTAELATRAVRSVLASRGAERASVIVVDSASRSGDLDLLRRNLDEIDASSTADISLMCMEANLGYGAGNNKAVESLLSDGRARFVWMLNSDAVADADALSRLFDRASSDRSPVIWGATICDPRTPDVVRIAGGGRYQPLLDLNWFPMRGRKVSTLTRVLDDRRIDYISGASLFMPLELFRSIGLLSEEWVAYYEEIDFCLRARLAGVPLKWCRDAIVYHDEGGSFGGARTPRKEYHVSRAALAFMRRHRGRVFPVVAFARLARRTVLVGVRGRWDLMRALVAAYRDHFARRVDPRWES